MSASAGQYFVSVDGVSTGTSTKTIFELKTPSTNRCRIIEWWIEFDGVTPTDAPIKVEVGRFSAAVTTMGSSFTPIKYYPPDATSAMTTAYNATTEGAGTATATFVHRISPTSGMYVQYPLDREMVMDVSSFFRIRVTAAVSRNATFGVSWIE